jgi:hypothetical protein
MNFLLIIMRLIMNQHKNRDIYEEIECLKSAIAEANIRYLAMKNRGPIITLNLDEWKNDLEEMYSELIKLNTFMVEKTRN